MVVLRGNITKIHYTLLYSKCVNFTVCKIYLSEAFWKDEMYMVNKSASLTQLCTHTSPCTECSPQARHHTEELEQEAATPRPLS